MSTTTRLLPQSVFVQKFTAFHLPNEMGLKDISTSSLFHLPEHHTRAGLQKVIDQIDRYCSEWNMVVHRLREVYAMFLQSERGAPSIEDLENNGTIREGFCSLIRIFQEEKAMLDQLPSFDFGAIFNTERKRTSNLLSNGHPVQEMSGHYNELEARLNELGKLAKGRPKKERLERIMEEAIFARDLTRLCEEDLHLLKENIQDPAELLRNQFWIVNIEELRSYGIDKDDTREWVLLYEEVGAFRAGISAFDPHITFSLPDDKRMPQLLEFSYQSPPKVILLYEDRHPHISKVAEQYAAWVLFCHQIKAVVTASSADRHIIAQRYYKMLEFSLKRNSGTMEEDDDKESGTISRSVFNKRRKLVTSYLKRDRQPEESVTGSCNPLVFVGMKEGKEGQDCLEKFLFPAM